MQEIVYFYPTGHTAHAELGHPERPERVEAIKRTLETHSLWNSRPKLDPIELTEALLHKVHDPLYLTRLQGAVQSGQRRIDADTYLTPASWDLARTAAGGAAAVALAVWQGKAQRGFALSRPPGHHATANQAMGFCLLNNDAIAAQAVFDNGAKKLALVDMDLHHGNGTQDIFWERPELLFISTHQHPLYPGTGLLHEIGGGQGEGTTVNLPLPPHSGDAALTACLERVILPMLKRFQPEMLLVTAGFDAHWRDPLGHLLFSANGFAQAISLLSRWADENCQGRIVMLLAGGYDVEAAAVSGLAATQAMLGMKWKDPIGPSPLPEEENWKKVLAHACNVWDL